MASDLERVIGSIESEGPSPEFVERLRARIRSEAGERPSEVAEQIPEMRFVPEDDDEPAAPRWPRFAAAAVVLVLVLGIFVESTADRGRGVEVDSAGGALVADATVVTDERTLLDAGTYRMDTLGTPFTLTMDEPLSLQANSRAITVVGHPASQEGADRVLTFARLSELVDPGRPDAGFEDDGMGWPTSDFRGWAEAVSGDFMVTEVEEVALGGRDALSARLELGFGCARDVGPCTAIGTTGAEPIPLYQDTTYRLWIVDQDVEDPVLVLAGFVRDSDAGWFDTVDSILSTIAFGATEPNPIGASTPGPIESPFFGGVRFELPAGSFSLRDPRSGDEVVIEDWPARSAFVSSPSDADGSVLSTPAQIADAVRSGGSEVTSLGTTSVDGFDTEVFDVVGASSEPVLLTASGGTEGWRAPSRGRLWVIDHPDRGLLMLTAEAFDLVDAAFPVVVADTEQVAETLEFVDG